jgi:hypothetical protein
MFIALASLFVPILLIGGLLRALGGTNPIVVDTTAAISDAKAANLFVVLVPQGLDGGWKPVQAIFRRTGEGTTAELRLGYLSPAGGQLLLVESNEPAGSLLAQELGNDVSPQGEVAVNSTTWDASQVHGDERALVNTTDSRTIIVVGRSSADDLTRLAASLR